MLCYNTQKHMHTSKAENETLNLEISLKVKTLIVSIYLIFVVQNKIKILHSISFKQILMKVV